MLDPVELARTAADFGVADEQVLRDHMISHVLHALAALDQPIVFFGGTALARTWVSEPGEGGRLSEDIDLYTAERPGAARKISADLPRMLRREYPGAAWTPSLSDVRAVEPASLVSREGLAVRVQLPDTHQHRELGEWPTETRRIEMRYADVKPVELQVPTLTSFAAMKTVAWMDRAAARDLYDLAVLARLGALTRETTGLVRRITGWTVAPYVFRTMPNFDWTAQLAHQTRDLPSARAASTSCAPPTRARWAGTTERVRVTAGPR